MHKSLLSNLFVLACIAGVSSPACAQYDNTGDVKTDTIIVATAAENFESADIDQSGTLDQDEFVSFAVMRAKAGDEAYKGTIMSGEYDVTFTSTDTNADGAISLEEAGAVSPDSDEDAEMDSETNMDLDVDSDPESEAVEDELEPLE